MAASSPSKPALSLNTYIQIARRCTTPYLQTDMIPELLQALSVIETLRKLALETCAVALIYGGWYDQRQGRDLPLTSEGRATLSEHKATHSEYRMVYIKILQNLCQLVSP
jgi:hypothetical protein